MSQIGEYALLEDFRTVGGGRCQWTFAAKDGAHYFIKRFLSPKQVVPGAPGGPATINTRKASCALFENRQNRLLAMLAGKSGKGGNLIAPMDFFSYDGSYYKVTEKIDNKGMSAEMVSRLSYANQEMILRSAANSIRILHSSKIVHGDLKKDNIIIRKRADGTTTASIIDFDDSYFESEPPLPPEEFTFDPPYGAPEVFQFVLGPSSINAKRLTSSADVYSLGVVFCEYLSGEKPTARGARSRYSGEALLQGGSLQIPDLGKWNRIRPCLAAMLEPDPLSRPNLKEVLDQLKTAGPIADKPAKPARPRLVVNMGPRKASDGKAGAAAPTGRIVLKGTMLPKDAS